MEPRVPQKRRVRLIYRLEPSDTSQYAATPGPLACRAVTSVPCGVSHSDLGALLQRVTVPDRNAPALHGDEPGILELLHRAGHGLAAGADHLGGGLVRQGVLR